MRVGKQLFTLVAVIQSIIFLAHFFVYETWVYSLESATTPGGIAVRLALGVLSVSFVVSSLLAFRYTNGLLRGLYKVSAVWMGLLSFLFFAAAGAWVVFGALRLAGVDLSLHGVVETLFALALALGAVGLVNASWTRITRTTVRLANLPLVWRGRRVALVSDLHLGHVRSGGFLRRIVARIQKEKPDTVFIVGDLFDGTAIDALRAAEPLKQVTAPQGVYFVAGNHDLFRNDLGFLDAVAAAGVRILNDEKIEVDGLQILGVSYRTAAQRDRLGSVLREIGIDQDRASVLLTHAPDHPEVTEAAGVSLQVSGHTHLGQFVPWSWLARRAYGQFVYGLSRIGKMQVFTSSGAGTWGPPLRLGSVPEIVILEFQ
jgi:predicted MPP superfamily phosphohydrolase